MMTVISTTDLRRTMGGGDDTGSAPPRNGCPSTFADDFCTLLGFGKPLPAFDPNNIDPRLLQVQFGGAS
jgi:hypothetical protein